MAAEVIPLRRIKTVDPVRLAVRFCSGPKTPDKTCELRERRATPSRFDGFTRDPLDGFGAIKFAFRPRRALKLRLFRVFKLIGDLKDATPAAVYRPVAERMRRARWTRRL